MSRRFGSLYTLDEPVGRGAMGEVWRAHANDGRVLAVKLLRRELAEDRALVARFLLEHAALCQMRSPHVVGVHDLVAEGGRLGIVMDYVDGPDLQKELQARGTLPAAEAARLVAEVLTGVAVGHEMPQSIVHRDLKPANILLAAASDGSRRAMVTDFSIARIIDGTTSITGTSIGTPRYMAPELVEQGSVSPAVDVFSAGIMLYELLVGLTPFAHLPTHAAIWAAAERSPGRPDGISDALWAMIADLVAADPARRPSARVAADSLAALVDELAGQDALPRLTDPPSLVPRHSAVLRDLTVPQEVRVPQDVTDAATRPVVGESSANSVDPTVIRSPDLAGGVPAYEIAADEAPGGESSTVVAPRLPELSEETPRKTGEPQEPEALAPPRLPVRRRVHSLLALLAPLVLLAAAVVSLVIFVGDGQGSEGAPSGAQAETRTIPSTVTPSPSTSTNATTPLPPLTETPRAPIEQTSIGRPVVTILNNSMMQDLSAHAEPVVRSNGFVVRSTGVYHEQVVFAYTTILYEPEQEIYAMELASALGSNDAEIRVRLNDGQRIPRNGSLILVLTRRFKV
ncbi:serine/threonine-protein kinase [Parafrankia sp. Ea1.12]|uniref:serine/threonine-protein kinase n=1 Tax=Parafrankia sp. Ea1.12 TaxID=573499 RepID=UPI00135A99EA|nr:serine/threonine-protein kinase [Parafrankia sp. Ea1.12]